MADDEENLSGSGSSSGLGSFEFTLSDEEETPPPKPKVPVPDMSRQKSVADWAAKTAKEADRVKDLRKSYSMEVEASTEDHPGTSAQMQSTATDKLEYEFMNSESESEEEMEIDDSVISDRQVPENRPPPAGAGVETESESETEEEFSEGEIDVEKQSAFLESFMESDVENILSDGELSSDISSSEISSSEIDTDDVEASDMDDEDRIALIQHFQEGLPLCEFVKRSREDKERDKANALAKQVSALTLDQNEKAGMVTASTSDAPNTGQFNCKSKNWMPPVVNPTMDEREKNVREQLEEVSQNKFTLREQLALLRQKRNSEGDGGAGGDAGANPYKVDNLREMHENREGDRFSGYGGTHDRYEDDDDDIGSSRHESRGARGGRGRGRGRGGRGRGQYRGGGDGNRRPRGEGYPEGHEGFSYVTPPFLEGEAKYQEQIQSRSGHGINFDDYECIEVTVAGEGAPTPVTTFEELNLNPVLLESVRKVKYEKPTPVQKYATPTLMKNRDVLATAETGSGKTAAFLLPILHHLMAEGMPLTPKDTFPATPEALILTPTRELCLQIGKESHVYAGDSSIKTCVMYGGASLFAQRNTVLEGINVLVTTPGRLRQFLGDEFVSLEKIQYLILDEADRMLDLGFLEDLIALNYVLPAKEKRVTGMFSATFAPLVRKLAEDMLNNPIQVTVGMVGGACKDIHQEFIPVVTPGLNSHHERVSRIIEIVRASKPEDKVLVFCNLRRRTDTLAVTFSSYGLSATSIHGDRLQRQREKALTEFRSGLRKILVTTPVGARGIDIPVVSIVINFDLPTPEAEHHYQRSKTDDGRYQNRSNAALHRERLLHPLGSLGKHDKFWIKKAVDEYVHRIGRTGRVGNPGRAISFYNTVEHKLMAPCLVEVLNNARQEVPAFLQKDADEMLSNLSGFPQRSENQGKRNYEGRRPNEEDEEGWL